MNMHVKLSYEFDINIDEQLNALTEEGAPTLYIKHNCEEQCKHLFIAPINKKAAQILPANYTESQEFIW